MTAKDIIDRLSTFEPDEEVYLALVKNNSTEITVARTSDVGYFVSDSDGSRSPLLTIRAEV